MKKVSDDKPLSGVGSSNSYLLIAHLGEAPWKEHNY